MCVCAPARAEREREREEHVLQKLWVIRGIKLEFQGEKKGNSSINVSGLTFESRNIDVLFLFFSLLFDRLIITLLFMLCISSAACCNRRILWITAYRMHFILNSVLLLNNFIDMSFDQRKPFPVKDCSPTLLFNHSHQLFHSFTIYFPLVGLSYEVSNNLVFSAVFPLVFDDGMRCYISISRKFMLAYNIYMAFYNLSAEIHIYASNYSKHNVVGMVMVEIREH